MTEKIPDTAALTKACREEAERLAACLRSLEAGKTTMVSAAASLGLTPQAFVRERKHCFANYIKKHIRFTPELAVMAYIASETPSDRLLKMVFGISKHVPAVFPDYKEENITGPYLDTLSEKQRAVVLSRFGFPDGDRNKTIKETAADCRLTETDVTTTLMHAVTRLRRPNALALIFPDEKTIRLEKQAAAAEARINKAMADALALAKDTNRLAATKEAILKARAECTRIENELFPEEKDFLDKKIKDMWEDMAEKMGLRAANAIVRQRNTKNLPVQDTFGGFLATYPTVADIYTIKGIGKQTVDAIVQYFAGYGHDIKYNMTPYEKYKASKNRYSKGAAKHETKGE